MATQLTCPTCGETVPADNINIQKLVAVCPDCDTVFQFEPPEVKAKRRKVKQPPEMTVTDDGQRLELAFHTNFRLDANENYQGMIAASIITLVAAVIMIFLAADGELPPVLPFLMAAGFAFFSYMTALITYNRTHIVVDDQQINVSRQPLPALNSQPTVIPLSGMDRATYEETPVSIREGYDTPRYHVWAEMLDGTRRLIVTDMVDDYAPYITQRLNQHLSFTEEEALDRLSDRAIDVPEISDEDSERHQQGR